MEKRFVPDDERLLVQCCLRGDQEAMLALVNRYRTPVLALCCRMLGQRQDAEDVVQETFVRALKYLSRWDSGRDFKTWLFAIAGNCCRSALARRRSQPAMQELVEPLADRTSDPAEYRQLNEEVQLALGRLRAEHRAAFVLFHEHQLSYLEIADVLGRPLGTVRTWVHRARQQLIAHLCRRGVVKSSHFAT